MKQNTIRKIIFYFGCISIVSLLIVGIKRGCVWRERNQKVREIANYNLQVYNMLSYGDPGKITNINDIVRSGVGHCGHYSFLLWYKLCEDGYESQIIDVRSFSQNAIHSVVECKVLGKYYVFDPTNGLYYKNSLEELCSNLSKGSIRIYQVNEEAVIDVYASDNFWSGVYQTTSYNSAVMRSDDSYSSGYIDNISCSVNNVFLNAEKCDQALLLDNNPQSNIMIAVGQNDFVEIEIELTGEEKIGILAIDFLEIYQSLKNIKLYYYDRAGDRFTLLNEYAQCEQEISSKYEFFLRGIKTNKLKIVGEPAYNEMDSICLNEIILLESIDICDSYK